MNLLVKLYGTPDAHTIPFCHGVRTFDGLGKAGPDVAGRLSAVAKTSKTNPQDKTWKSSSNTGWSRRDGAIPGSLPISATRPFLSTMPPLLRLLLLQVALLRHAMGILTTGSDPAAAAAAGKGRQWATRTSLCNLSCCNLATLHEDCSGFGLGVAASFRLIAQSHLGSCWSWSSATHPLLCACSLLTPRSQSTVPQQILIQATRSLPCWSDGGHPSIPLSSVWLPARHRLVFGFLPAGSFKSIVVDVWLDALPDRASSASASTEPWARKKWHE